MFDINHVTFIHESEEFMALKGIVHRTPVWVSFGRPVFGSIKLPELQYHQKFRNGLAKLCSKNAIVPPGA